MLKHLLDTFFVNFCKTKVDYVPTTTLMFIIKVYYHKKINFNATRV